MSSSVSFVLVSDAEFFPGCLAAVASIRTFHAASAIYVVDNHVAKKGLTPAQSKVLRSLDVQIVSATALANNGRKLAAWELKAYAADAIIKRADLLVGVDSDCVLCGPIHDVLDACGLTGNFFGGQDRRQVYDEKYRIYGIETPAHNNAYMSTSLYVCQASSDTRAILAEWARCCSQAMFGKTGNYPGYGDQGVLNAILFKNSSSVKVELLDNDLWSQHWTYWSKPLTVEDGRLFNGEKRAMQRAIHATAGPKPWTKNFREKLKSYPHVKTNYAWFLQFLVKGCSITECSLQNLLEAPSMHICEDIAAMQSAMECFDRQIRIW